MQLYVVTWGFESSQDQLYASNFLVEYVENRQFDSMKDGFEKIICVHTPQDGTGVIICRANDAKTLFRVFGPWRDRYGMNWEYKPGLLTDELINLIKEK